jgi:hypothetical protein
MGTVMHALTKFATIFVVGLCLLAAHPSQATANTTCRQTLNGQLCTAQVNFSQFAQFAYQTQLESQWCWAASIAMVFSYYGHPVSQPRIVEEAYGSVVDMPAVAGSVMAQALNRTWADDRGEQFTAHLNGVYDPQAGVSTLDNNALIHELDQNRPFIIGTAGHAVVVTAMTYYPAQPEPLVVVVGVFDPWPTSGGARTLSVEEMTPATQGGGLSFAATASVGSTSPVAPPPSNDHGGVAPVSLSALLILVLALGARRRCGSDAST